MKTLQKLFYAFAMLCCSIPTISQSRAEKLEAMLTRYTADLNASTPGMTIRILAGDSVILQKSYGAASVENNVMISEETVFNIGSISKQFLAFIILQFENEGKLKTSDRVSKYMPEYSIFQQYPITISHMLFHTSGLMENLELHEIGGYRNATISMEDEKKLLADQTALNFMPGTQYSYSNTGYSALALLAEKISGKRLPALMAERIFIPLNMKHSFVMDDPNRIIPKLAWAYNKSGEEYVRFQPSDADYGPGNIHTTITDLMKWGRNYKKQEVGKEVFLKFFNPGYLDNGEKTNYGYGLFIEHYKQLPTIEMAGGRRGYLTELMYFPQQDVTICILSNSRHFRLFEMAKRIADVVLENEFPLTAVNTDVPGKTAVTHQPLVLSAKNLKTYEGLFWQPKTSLLRKIYFKNDTLFYQRPGGIETAMVPVNHNKFVFSIGGNLTNTQVIFSKGSSRKTDRLFVVSEMGDTTAFHSYTQANYSDEQLDQFSGSFFNKDADAIFRVYKKSDGVISLEVKGWKKFDMKPVFKDYFIHDQFGSIMFIRNRKGKIIGLHAKSGKTNNLHFTKMIPAT
jgi:CubicO group peptidase (beta-lactamase class C family)